MPSLSPLAWGSCGQRAALSIESPARRVTEIHLQLDEGVVVLPMDVRFLRPRPQLRMQPQDFLWWCERSARAAPRDVRQVVAEPEA